MGNVVFTTKTDFIRNCKCYGFDAIALVDSQYDLVELRLDPNVIQVGSVLVPSYDAINAYMDGNLPAFNELYMAQLASRECDEFISLIAYAIFLNKNIAIYVGEEESLVSYIDALAGYIRMNFGIIIGVENECGTVDPSFYDLWIAKFYSYGFITCDDFLSMYTPNRDIPVMVLNKLVIDNPPDDCIQSRILVSVDMCNQWYKNQVCDKHGIRKSLYTRQS